MRPEIFAGGFCSRPMTARAETDLPDPDSPTMPSVSPGADRPAHPVDRLDHTGVGVELDVEVLDGDERLARAS